MMKRFSALLAALLLVFSMASLPGASAEDGEPHYTLPIDFSAGMPVDQKNYLSDTVYEDPTIKVVISTDAVGDIPVWIADIEIKDASQLRTVAAESFDTTQGEEYGSVLAKRVNAIVAVDGDFYSFSQGKPLVVRQGITFLDKLHVRSRHTDILLIDENGDFYGLESPKEAEVDTMMSEHKIINGFYFGPVLVNNGKMTSSDNPSLVKTQFSQRVAIAQTGHLKYRIIAAGSKQKRFQFEPWRKYVGGMEDILVAYNLDGGDSAVLVFNNVKINCPENTNERPLADMIYFASAWPGE